MTDLPPFSGELPSCPKCGNSGASTKYLGFGICQHTPDGLLLIGGHLNERLHRECRRCSYAWDEAVNHPEQPAKHGDGHA